MYVSLQKNIISHQSDEWQYIQVRGEERVEEEQRRSRELMQRVERERQLEVADAYDNADVSAN